MGLINLVYYSWTLMQLLLTTSVDQEIRRSLISFFFLQRLEKKTTQVNGMMKVLQTCSFEYVKLCVLYIKKILLKKVPEEVIQYLNRKT